MTDIDCRMRALKYDQQTSVDAARAITDWMVQFSGMSWTTRDVPACGLGCAPPQNTFTCARAVWYGRIGSPEQGRRRRDLRGPGLPSNRCCPGPPNRGEGLASHHAVDALLW
jgi:hypothetical protein